MKQEEKKHPALNPFPLMLFACGDNQSFAKQVASHMTKKLENVKFKQFNDGDFIEHHEDSIRDRNLFVICQPGKGDAKWKDIMRCYALVYALRQGSPKSWITVVMPYLPFSRQDKPSNLREPVLATLIPVQLQAVGANQIVVVKLHNPASRTVYPLLKMEDIDTTDIIVQYIKEYHPKDSKYKLAAPDTGATKSVRSVAEKLGVGIVIIDKDRDEKLANKADVMNVIGDADGYDIIMIDDVVDTAITLTKGANALRDKGAKRIFGIFTHPGLSKGAIENLEAGNFERIVFMNTFSLLEEDLVGLKRLGNCHMIDITKIVGETIDNLHNGDSIESLWKQKGTLKIIPV